MDNKFDLSTTIPSLETNEEIYSVYPNPASDHLSIDGNTAIDQISIFDLSGNYYGSYHDTHSIDIHELPAGLYEIQIQARDGSSCVKPFIKID